MNASRWAAVLIVSAAPVLLLGWLSRAPYDPPGSDVAVLRMSWRLRGERIEECRPRTQAELDALPVHMRTPEICEGHLVAYRLVVQVGNRPADSLVFVPQGAKGDRPVFVMHEVPLAEGPQRVSVSFSPISEDPADDARNDNEDEDGDDDEDEDADEGESDDDDRSGPLRYAGIVTGRAGVVELITVDGAGRLVKRSGSPSR